MGVGRIASFLPATRKTDIPGQVFQGKINGSFSIIPKHSIDLQSQQKLPAYAPQQWGNMYEKEGTIHD
jgi:hypothetical protein